MPRTNYAEIIHSLDEAMFSVLKAQAQHCADEKTGELYATIKAEITVLKLRAQYAQVCQAREQTGSTTSSLSSSKGAEK